MNGGRINVGKQEFMIDQEEWHSWEEEGKTGDLIVCSHSLPFFQEYATPLLTLTHGCVSNVVGTHANINPVLRKERVQVHTYRKIVGIILLELSHKLIAVVGNIPGWVRLNCQVV